MENDKSKICVYLRESADKKIFEGCCVASLLAMTSGQSIAVWPAVVVLWLFTGVFVIKMDVR